ncbi:cupin domain-containing protein [Povalibacter sp.]|uniref:cupin domain-containing protein n=1 Tax=Povalibacter sp. TaxID=1962978 RepID=UPI002F3F2C40
MSYQDEELPDSTLQALALALKPAELSESVRRRLRERVLQQAHEVASTGTFTVRAGEAAWIEIAPFIQMKLLRRDQAAGNQTVLMRMQPGGIVPPHRHAHEEEFLVLEGECCIGDLQLRAGDAHIAAAGSWHEAVTTRTGVLVLLRGEYPLPCTG